MEDIGPFLIFIIIIIVNIVKFVSERGKPKKTTNSQKPRQVGASLESFFESLIQPPKPTKIAEWPEEVERPDYIHETDEFEFPNVEEYEEPPAPPAPTPQPTISTPPKTQSPQPSIPQNRFTIQGKKQLKQAMLAHLIFSPPPALEPPQTS